MDNKNGARHIQKGNQIEYNKKKVDRFRKQIKSRIKING